MTFVTAKHLAMHVMAKWHFTNTFCLECKVTGVTGRATSGNTKYYLAIVTGPAGLTFLHGFHRDKAVGALFLENLRMAHVASHTAM